MIQEVTDCEFFFDSIDSLREFMEEDFHFIERHTTNRLHDHFERDWVADETIKRLGMTAIKPVLCLDTKGKARYDFRDVSIAVMCEEGMITVEEIRLAEKESEYMPTLSEILEATKSIRDGWDGPQTELARDNFGFSGPGIRECSVEVYY